jgi:hypothetical protein
MGLMEVVAERIPSPESQGWKMEKSGCEENPGVFDVGNGALEFYRRHPRHTDVRYVEFRSYSSQQADDSWFSVKAADSGKWVAFGRLDRADAFAGEQRRTVREKKAAVNAAREQADRRRFEAVESYYAKTGIVPAGYSIHGAPVDAGNVARIRAKLAGPEAESLYVAAREAQRAYELGGRTAELKAAMAEAQRRFENARK